MSAQKPSDKGFSPIVSHKDGKWRLEIGRGVFLIWWQTGNSWHFSTEGADEFRIVLPEGQDEPPPVTH